MKHLIQYTLAINLCIILSCQSMQREVSKPKVTLIDKSNIVPAQLKSSRNLCDTLKYIWESNIAIDPEVKKSIDFSSDVDGYYFSFAFTIDTNNLIRRHQFHIGKRRVDSLIALPYLDLVIAHDWECAKEKKGEIELHPLKSTIAIWINITRKGLSSIEFTDEKSLEQIIDCDY